MKNEEKYRFEKGARGKFDDPRKLETADGQTQKKRVADVQFVLEKSADIPLLPCPSAERDGI